MTKTCPRKWNHYKYILRQHDVFYQVEIHHNRKSERHSEPTPADAKTYAE